MRSALKQRSGGVCTYSFDGLPRRMFLGQEKDSSGLEAAVGSRGLEWKNFIGKWEIR